MTSNIGEGEFPLSYELPHRQGSGGRGRGHAYSSLRSALARLDGARSSVVAAGSGAGVAEGVTVDLRADPLRESPRAALIRVHLAEGNPSEAAKELSRYRKLLAAELHMEPTARLRNLVEGR